jgi:SAM-dependent methyltransferase
MNRDLSRLDDYLDRLADDVYPQPPDPGHTKWAYEVFDNWLAPLVKIENVLDVGCGDTAFMKSKFEGLGWGYTGIALGVTHPDVVNLDFTFIPVIDETYDIVFSRHALEHSPMPVITLMEWARVAKKYLILVVPRPTTERSYVGRNHYSVANKEQLKFWLELAGWEVLKDDDSEGFEFRLFCGKVQK